MRIVISTPPTARGSAITLDGEDQPRSLDLVAQAIGANHQYPDGFALFLGTMFSPTKHRHGPGLGFTHAVGDLVTVSTPALGALVNRVDTSDAIAPWTFGARALMETLGRRGLL